MKLNCQRTISTEGSLSGIGLHTGAAVTVTFRPAPAGSGIRFFRSGKEASYDRADRRSRCTSVGSGETEILTVEHLVAAVRGLGITNVDVEVDGPEIPGADGSALSFVRFLKQLGLSDQKESASVYKIREPIFCGQEGASICVFPSDEFSVHYVLDYPHPELRDQRVEFTWNSPEEFERQIAPARTFCTDDEAHELRRRGLGAGANRENTLVVERGGGHQSSLRFPDECARHKVLDLMGDLGLLPFTVMGRFVAIRSGHALNAELARQIAKQKGVTVTDHSKKNFIGIEEIKKTIPHRYPFLLVDRVTAMDGSHIVGIKNVTANEPFFQGHFPQKPVMPGVLIIEAMAQLGGILMLKKSNREGGLAYLAAINHARFRKMVVPGDQLEMHIEVLKEKTKVGLIKGTAKVEGQPVCEAEIMFSFAD